MRDSLALSKPPLRYVCQRMSLKTPLVSNQALRNSTIALRNENAVAQHIAVIADDGIGATR